MMSVVHPAYHCDPNGGHGSFWPSASRRLSCVLVLATAAGSRRAVSSAFLPNHVLPGACHNIHGYLVHRQGVTGVGGAGEEDQNYNGRREKNGVHSAGYVIATNKKTVSKLVHE